MGDITWTLTLQYPSGEKTVLADSHRGSMPDVTRGETTTFTFGFNRDLPSSTRTPIERYELVRQVLDWAGWVSTQNALTQPAYREHLPADSTPESLVVRIEPGSGIQSGLGVWGVITGGSDPTTLVGANARLELEVYVLAEASEYASYSAVRSAFSPGIAGGTTSGGGGGGSGGATAADAVTASADGLKKTYSLSHSLGEAPDVAAVTPVSVDASTDIYVSNLSGSSVEVSHAAAPESGTNNLTYYIQSISGTTSSSEGDTVSVSADGTVGPFSLGHSLGSTPSGVFVQPTAESASTDFWVSNRTSSSVEVTYAAAPANGETLSFGVLTSSNGGVVSKTGDGSTTTVTLSHSLGSEPAAPVVMPLSESASTDYRITNKTSSAVEITYPTPPANGASLEWSVLPEA